VWNKPCNQEKYLSNRSLYVEQKEIIVVPFPESNLAY